MVDESDSSDGHRRGPQELVEYMLLSGYDIETIEDKHLLGERSKFKMALDMCQEDYRPSSEVSCRDQEKKLIYDYLKESLETQGCSESLCTETIRKTSRGFRASGRPSAWWKWSAVSRRSTARA
jgi:hypothetical protein